MSCSRYSCVRGIHHVSAERSSKIVKFSGYRHELDRTYQCPQYRNPKLGAAFVRVVDNASFSEETGLADRAFNFPTMNRW